MLAGDTHNGWANNLEDAEGKRVGVEFATASVSSGGLETYLKLKPKQAEEFARDLEVLVDDLVYSNTKDRGDRKLYSEESAVAVDIRGYG